MPAGNSLSGSLPLPIADLPNLFALSVSGNDFTGNIPPEYFEMETMRLLILVKSSSVTVTAIHDALTNTAAMSCMPRIVLCYVSSAPW